MKHEIIINEVRGITNLGEIAQKTQFKYENGYVSCLIKHSSNDEYYSVIAFVLDGNKKEVIPTRLIIINNELRNMVALFRTTIMKNNKAIYATNVNEFYLIDISKTNFDEKCIPKNYIIGFSGYYILSDNKMLIMINQKWYIYDINLNKIESYEFDNIRINNGTNEIIGVFKVRIDLEEHYVACIIDNNGKIKNDVSLDCFEFVVPSEVLEDVSLLKKYLVNNYVYLVENPPKIGGLIC